METKLDIVQKLAAAADQGNFTFSKESLSIPGKTVIFFDYEQTGDICGHGLRGAALYRYASGELDCNQYGPQVYQKYYDLLRSGDF